MIQKYKTFFSIIALFILILGTRVPFITADPGLDPDGYRVVNAAKYISHHGGYKSSRPPGYPVFEYLASLLVNHGPWSTNVLAAVFSGLAVVFFTLLLKYLDVKSYFYVSMGFAMTPVFYINSTVTMDYVVALAFILASSFFMLTQRQLLGGMLLGLAIGVRVTSVAIVIPLLIWQCFSSKKNSFRGKITFGLSSIIVGGICYVPVIWQYGFGHFSFYDRTGYPTISTLIHRSVVEVWGSLGIVGFLVLAIYILIETREVKKAIQDKWRPLVVSALIISVFVAGFLRLPHETAYLLPVVPFCLLSIAILFPPKVLKVFCALLILSPFLSVQFNGVSANGAILRHYKSRKSNQKEVRQFARIISELPQQSVVVAGWKRPLIKNMLEPDEYKCKLVSSINEENKIREFKEKGWKVYFLPGIEPIRSGRYNILVRSNNRNT